MKKKVKGKTVKLKVQFNPVAKDEKDGDVDFKVVITCCRIFGQYI